MGRVAKYKKVKSCDPYSKKNRGNIDLASVGVWGLGDNGRKAKKRSQKAERMHLRKMKLKSKKKSKNQFVDDGGFDVPPTEKDEFNMADLMGSVKRQKIDKDILGSESSATMKAITSDTKNKSSKSESSGKVATSTGNVASIPKSDDDEMKVTRLLKLDKQEEKKQQKQKQLSHARMEGESRNAFNKRVRAETRQIIKNSTTTKNLEKLQKKKDFLKNKKKSKRRKGESYPYDDADDDDDTYRRSTKGKDTSYDEPVRFGEQADRPPVFRQIPRGAKSKSKTTTQSSKLPKAEGMSEHQIEAERDAMELMRRRVQAQYKAIKSKRKDAGDFHL